MSNEAPASKISEVQQKLEAHLRAKFTSLKFNEPHRWAPYGLTVEVERKGALEFFRTLKTDPQLAFNMLIDVTCVDWMDRKEPRFEVVYQLLSLTYQHRLCVKIWAPEEDPEVESVRPVWEGANFLEREVWDMYGIRFQGHGDLRRILMYDEFVGHPLRKDYPLRGKQPRVPLRVPELRNTSADMHREQLVSLPVRPQFPKSAQNGS